jgi:hypothetical protein
MKILMGEVKLFKLDKKRGKMGVSRQEKRNAYAQGSHLAEKSLNKFKEAILKK